MQVVADSQVWMTFAILLAVIVAFSIDKIPLELSAIAALALLLVYFHVFPVTDSSGAALLGPEQLLRGFANPVLFTILGLLVLGQALFHTGVVDLPAQFILAATRQRPHLAVIACLLFAGTISAFLNNTPVVIIFLPLLAGVAGRVGVPLERVMMPLSFITIMGGSVTLIGSSANLIVRQIGEEAGAPPIGLFDFTVPGLILVSVGTLYVLFVMPRILALRGPSDSAEDGSADRLFLARMELTPGHPWIGLRAQAGLFPKLKGITIRLVRRGGQRFPRPFDEFELAEGDSVEIFATRPVLTELLNQVGHLRDIATGGGIGQDKLFSDREDSRRAGEDDDGVARPADSAAGMAVIEAVVAPGSSMHGRQVRNANLQGAKDCLIIGLRRQRRMLRVPIGDIRLRAGDVLLVLGAPDAVDRLRSNSDILLLEGSVAELPKKAHAARAMLIFGLTIAAAAVGIVPIVTAVFVGALAMVVFGCLSLAQALRAFDARIYLMIGTAFALAAALQATGGAALIASGVVSASAGYGPLALLSAIFLMTAVLTNVLSNQAAAALMTPVTMATVMQTGAAPEPFLHCIIFALNCSFATPMAYQTNLLVMAPGRYRFSDFVIAGLPLVLLMWLTFTLMAPIYYRL